MAGSTRLALLLLAAAIAACAPARRAETTALLRAGRAAETAAAGSAEPLPPLAQDPFLADAFGLGSAATNAATDAAAAAGDDPAVDGLPAVDSALRAHLKRERRGDVATTFVRRIAVRVDAPPSRLLEEILSVASEKAALEADEADDLGVPAAGARSMRVALLSMGPKPFQSDYRWAFTIRSRTRPDGAVLVRYEMASDPRTERVSLFLGAGVLVPDGGGTRWVEALAIGSPSSPPFFFKGKVRGEVDKVLARRARHLARACRAR